MKATSLESGKGVSKETKSKKVNIEEENNEWNMGPIIVAAAIVVAAGFFIVKKIKN